MRKIISKFLIALASKIDPPAGGFVDSEKTKPKFTSIRKRTKFEMTCHPYNEIRKIASDTQYVEIKTSDEYIMISFVKGDVRINVYPTKMTVSTCIDHPKQGKTQLHRRHVSLKQLREIFNNPRLHTGKGYHKKY